MRGTAEFLKAYQETLTESDEVIAIKAKLEQDPHNQDLHFELIELLKENDSIKLLRTARDDAVNKIHVNADFYLDWLRDEIAFENYDCDYIEALFVVAKKRYLFSVDIWKLHLEFTRATNPYSYLVMCYNAANSMASFNIERGFELLDMYQLAMLQSADKEPENKKKYFEEVALVYEKKLLIPYITTTSMSEEYQLFIAESELDMNLDVVEQYISLFPTFEEFLAEYNAGNYRTCIEMVENFECERNKDYFYKIVFGLYETYIESDLFNVMSWLEYNQYLRNLKLHDYSQEIITRAKACIPNSGLLWKRHLQICIYDLGLGKYELKEKLHLIINQINFPFAECYLLLWEELFQVFAHGSIYELDVLIDESINFMKKKFTINCTCLIPLYKMKILVSKNERPVDWFSLFCQQSLAFGKFLSDSEVCNSGYIWAYFINTMIELGLYDDAKNAFIHAVDVVHNSEANILFGCYLGCKSPAPVVISEKVFDKLFHKLELNESIKKRIDRKLLSEAKSNQPQKRSKSGLSKRKNEEVGKRKKLDVNSKDDNKSTLKITKTKEKEQEITAPTCEMKKMTVDPEKLKTTVFLSNMPFEATEDNIKELFKECGEILDVRISKSRAGNSKGFGYLEFANTASTEKALIMDRTLLLNRPLFVSVCKDKSSKDDNESKPRFDSGLNKKILFVSKLSRKTTEETLKNAFEDFSDDIKQVRIVANRSGVSKGYAYVEFVSEDSASKALLKLDQCIIDGEKISIEISNPPKKNKLNNDQAHISTVKENKSEIGRLQSEQHTSQNRTELSIHQKGRLQFLPRISQLNSSVSESKKSPMSNDDFRKLFKK